MSQGSYNIDKVSPNLDFSKYNVTGLPFESGVTNATDYGLSATASSADNVIAFNAAITAAVANAKPIIILPEGTFNINDQILVPSGITIRGVGRGKTIINYTKATGSAFRATDFSIGQSYNVFENLQLNATSSAVNTNTIGINLSSMSHSLVREVSIYNFGRQIDLNGFASGSVISTYYNSIENSLVAMGSAGYGFGIGIDFRGGANSNSCSNIKTSYLPKVFSFGNDANDAPNQISIINPIVEGWEGYVYYLNKAIGIYILGGRYEGANDLLYADDSIANVNSVTIDSPYIALTGSHTVLSTRNPSVQLLGGNYSSLAQQAIGIASSNVNLIANGGFEGTPNDTTYPIVDVGEINLTTWSANGATYIAQRSDYVHSGAYSGRLGDGVNLDVGLFFDSVAINPNQNYTFSWWSLSPSTATGGYRLVFRIYDSTGTEITTGSDILALACGDNGVSGTSTFNYSASFNSWLSGSNITFTAADTWYLNNYIFRFPSNAYSIKIGFVHTANAAQYIHFDDVQLVAGTVTRHWQDKPLNSSGSNTHRGTLTSTALVVSNPRSSFGNLLVLPLSAGIRLREMTGDRIYYDAYNHVFRNQSGTELNRINEYGIFLYNYTYTAGGTTGTQAINKPTGSVNFAIGATSLVVTNNICTVNSIVMAIVMTNDATMTSVQVVPAAGSFTLYANAAPTAETRVGFIIINR